MAYETTSVPIESSQASIRKLLVKFGAERFQFAEGRTETSACVQHVGKKAAGRELDGRTWEEYPR